MTTTVRPKSSMEVEVFTLVEARIHQSLRQLYNDYHRLFWRHTTAAPGPAELWRNILDCVSEDRVSQLAYYETRFSPLSSYHPTFAVSAFFFVTLYASLFRRGTLFRFDIDASSDLERLRGPFLPLVQAYHANEITVSFSSNWNQCDGEWVASSSWGDSAGDRPNSYKTRIRLEFYRHDVHTGQYTEEWVKVVGRLHGEVALTEIETCYGITCHGLLRMVGVVE